MTPDTKQAREELISILADDLASSFTGDRDTSHLVALLKKGFVGFSNMTLDELRQAAADAGLDSKVAVQMAAVKGAAVELEGPDFTVTLELSVTAESAIEAVQNAMDDLSDPALRWTARVKDVQAEVSVDIDTSVALGDQ